MAWTDKIFNYCERGGDPGFWAEPFNAISNAAFLIAALAAGWEIARRPPGDPPVPRAASLLAALVFIIGIGSFLFHTYATRWAAVADVAPIGMFMVAYMAYALRVFVRLPWVFVALGVAAFVVVLRDAGPFICGLDLSGWGIKLGAPGSGRCLNGTAGYVPAFLAMTAVGAVLAAMRHRAGPYLILAGGLFLLSMTLRALDLELCAATRWLGQQRGTHAFWHLLNAATLYILLLAAIRHGRSGARPEAGPVARPPL